MRRLAINGIILHKQTGGIWIFDFLFSTKSNFR